MRAADLDLTAKRSLPAAWVQAWAHAPSAPMLFDRRRGWMHAAELEAATRRVAGRLQGAGLGCGDRMMFSAESSLELVIAHIAALRAGIVVVPTNTAYREREITHIASDARPKAALVDEPDRADWVRAAAGNGTIVIGPDVDLHDHEPSVLDVAAPNEPAIIGYTSGTTGSPKGRSSRMPTFWREARQWSSRGAGLRPIVSFSRYLCFTLTDYAWACTVRYSRVLRVCFSPASTSTPFLTQQMSTTQVCFSACPPCITGLPSHHEWASLPDFACVCLGRHRCPPSYTVHSPS
jgi:acyl-CoA synthetase (AMP-forming)/AMP-acid ligase II